MNNSIGFSVAKKAARFAVYDETIIRTKNHHIPVTILVETALRVASWVRNMENGTHIGAISVPCCISAPAANQPEFCKLNWLTRNSGSSIQGYGLVHSS